MELYQQILAVHIGALRIDPQAAKEIVESDSYKALEKIRAILADETLSDAECFRKIEAVVCVFEELAIANGGYSDMVMEAASAAGAQGGTVLHTRATDADNANKFFGMAITEEREMILLVTPADKRAAIMQAIMEKAGAQSAAQSVVFSVKLDDVAGLYSRES